MGIVETAKEAVKLAKKIDNIKLNRKILDLQAEAIELTEQNREKDELIQKLKESLSLKGKFHNEKVIDGPFCAQCFDADHQKYRLLPTAKQGLGHGWVQCPRCKVPFQAFKTARYLQHGKFER
ncbi:MAG: hypothetical protein ACYTE5_08330 [Planctomycetota bacterium]|jgi:hypothetical protein